MNTSPTRPLHSRSTKSTMRLVGTAFLLLSGCAEIDPADSSEVGSEDLTTSSWVDCARAGGTCAFSGTRRVRYGVSGKYSIATFTDGADCRSRNFGTQWVWGATCAYEQVSTTPDVAPEPTPTPNLPPLPNTGVIHTRGRHLYDTCGQELVIRGVEEFAFHGEWHDNWPQEMNNARVNAVRILDPNAHWTLEQLDRILSYFASNRIVVFITTGEFEEGHTWFLRSDVKALLSRYSAWTILDAYQEAQFDDRARWEQLAKESIDILRRAGYRQPLTVIGNQYGRDLVSVLERGQALVDYDPEHNLILGWQAYWYRPTVDDGWDYWDHYLPQMGLTPPESEADIDRLFAQVADVIATKNFPIQLGLERFTEGQGDEKYQRMDYEFAMEAAERHGLGWLWWCWRVDADRLFSATGSNDLTPLGQDVYNRAFVDAERACAN